MEASPHRSKEAHEDSKNKLRAYFDQYVEEVTLHRDLSDAPDSVDSPEEELNAEMYEIEETQKAQARSFPGTFLEPSWNFPEMEETQKAQGVSGGGARKHIYTL